MVKCKLLTVGEVQELNDMLEKYPNNVTAPIVTNRLSKQIISVDDNTDREFITSFVIKLPIMDSKFIRNSLSNSEPKLDLERSLNAPSGEELTVRVTFGVEFFRPFF